MRDAERTFAIELLQRDKEKADFEARHEVALNRIQAVAAASVIVWAAIGKVGNHEEEDKANDGWSGHMGLKEASEQMIVIFESKQLGFDWNKDGIVTKVEASGQGRRAHLSVGMIIGKINKSAFNANILRRCIAAGEQFAITFGLPRCVHRWELQRTVEAFKNVRMFQEAGCSDAFLKYLAGQAEERAYQEGEMIVDAKENAETIAEKCMFLLEKGTAEVLTHSGEEVVVRATLSAGAVFGEYLLLGIASTHMESLRAVDTCRVLVLTQSAVVKGLEAFPVERTSILDMAFTQFYRTQHIEDSSRDADDSAAGDRVRRFVVSQAVKQSPRFAGLSTAFIHDLSEHTKNHVKVPGEVVVEQGTHGDSMFVIISGHAAVHRNGRLVGTLGAGSFFGELGMLGVVRQRSASVIADALSCLWEVTNDEFEAVLSKHPDMKQEFKQFVAFTLEYSIPDRFTNLNMFKSFSKAFTRSLSSQAGRRVHFAGTSVFSESMPMEGYFVLNQGEAVLTRRGVAIERCQAGNQFNVTALQGGNHHNNYGSLVAIRCSHFLVLTFDSYWRSIKEFGAWELHRKLSLKIKSDWVHYRRAIRQHINDNMRNIGMTFKMGRGSQRLQSVFKAWASHVVLQSEMYTASARVVRLSVPKAQLAQQLHGLAEKLKDSLPQKTKYHASPRLAELASPRKHIELLEPEEPAKRNQKSAMHHYKVRQVEWIRPRSPRGIDRYA
eukprot:TRINITY_DN6518_c0_g1_i1.p1 TRINITY_DN6518_c0_g1~~TRINITY_DN6518_c0_g1_i1.p1  ORF type:complete len:722 (+),score=123.68 TRINITY_DN6518_c0_g1_i1:175-2340(+)